MWWTLLSTSHAGAWILHTDRPSALRRALRAARRAEITRAVAYDDTTVCVETSEPSLRTRNRVERHLRGPVESRLDCDWGWYPEGTGWVAVVVERPADTLLSALEQLRWPYYDLQAVSNGPLRVCVAETVAGDPDELRRALEETDVPVRGVRRVGACRREP